MIEISFHLMFLFVYLSTHIHTYEHTLIHRCIHIHLHEDFSVVDFPMKMKACVSMCVCACAYDLLLGQSICLCENKQLVSNFGALQII